MSKKPVKRRRSAQAPPAPQRPGRKSFVAPWRSEYIFGPKSKSCFFCEASALPDDDEAAWKAMLLVHRGPGGMVLLNRFPYTGGHLLIAPRRHTADLPGLTASESEYLWENARRSVAAIDSVLHAQGYNLGMNLGRAAGAGIEEHLHMHALPRWQGDTNFMHIIADTSTVPISLDKLWEQMRAYFQKL